MSEMVPEGWSKQRLGDSLTSLPKSALPSGVSEEAGYYNFYVCSQNVLKSFHKEMSSPSLLFSTGGEAAVHFATGVYSYSTDVWATEVKGELCNEYAFRFLQKSIEKINYVGFQGSGIKHLDKDFIRNLEFFAPPLPEQQKIASILTSVDEVIEKTQLQINKLQNLKKATMNELLTRGIGHTEFKDSELGRIPEGWSKQRLGDSLTSLPKSALPSGVSEEAGYYNFYVCSQNVLKSFHKEMSSPSLLFSTGGEAAVHFATGVYSYSTDVWATEVKGELCNEYAFRFLQKSIEKINYVGFQGSGIKHLDKDFIRNLEFFAPPLPEQQKIASILTSIDNVIEQTQSQLEQTQSLKKSLMQDLLTGKVRVSVN